MCIRDSSKINKYQLILSCTACHSHTICRKSEEITDKPSVAYPRILRSHNIILLFFGTNMHYSETSKCTRMKFGTLESLSYNYYSHAPITKAVSRPLTSLAGMLHPTRVGKFDDSQPIHWLFPKRCNTGPHLLLSVNSKSHTGHLHCEPEKKHQNVCCHIFYKTRLI